jgi:hypothetical protein
MTITYTTTIAMTGYTTVTATDVITVEAIDYVQYATEHGDSAVEVNLSAANAALTRFIAVMSNSYPDETTPGTPDITYKWNGIGTTAIPLGNHHVYSSGMDELTAGTTKLYVYNAGTAAASDALMTIIVGRVTA